MTLPLVRLGTGPKPLVALHGFMGRGTDWADLSALLPHYTIFAPDLPGHGAAASATACGMEDAAQAVLLTLDAHHVRTPVPLLGYSMGARLALYLALTAPERWSALVMESGSPGLNSEAERQARIALDAQRAHALEADPHAFVRDWSRQPLFATQTSEQRERRERQRLAEAPAGWAASLRGMGTGAQPNLWPRLPDLHVPTLLLTGTHDAKFTALAREMHRLMPNTRHVELPTGHAPHIEALGAYAEAVQAFNG